HLQLFCAGQFACDRVLYTSKDLIETVSKPECRDTCLIGNDDQKGMNLLAFLSEVPFTNLTLPPYNMESSWTGDYQPGAKQFWQDPERMPYLLHYYGFAHLHHLDWEVMAPFRELLSKAEQADFMEEATSFNKSRVLWDKTRL